MSARPVLPYLWMTFGAFSFAVMSTLISAVSPWCDWQFIAIGRTFLAMTFAAGLATASGAKLVRVPAHASAGFHPDLKALEAAVTPNTRAIFLATPSNPSGVVLSGVWFRRVV